jgi:hypothetical protein
MSPTTPSEPSAAWPTTRSSTSATTATAARTTSASAEARPRPRYLSRTPTPRTGAAGQPDLGEPPKWARTLPDRRPPPPPSLSEPDSRRRSPRGHRRSPGAAARAARATGGRGVPGDADDLPVGIAQPKNLPVVARHIDGVGADRLVKVLGLAAAHVTAATAGRRGRWPPKPLSTRAGWRPCSKSRLASGNGLRCQVSQAGSRSASSTIPSAWVAGETREARWGKGVPPRCAS